MKILAIGDFHGKFPEKLKREAMKADLILVTGDFANSDKIRKIIFKHWTAKRWWEVAGMKKAAKLEKESFDSGLRVLKELNSIKKKVYFVWGNADFYKEFVTSEPSELMPGFYDNKIKKMKNLIPIDRKKKKVDGIDLIGHGKYLNPTEFIINPIDQDEKKQERRFRGYKRDEKRLNKLFLKYKPKNFIFLMHYTPYKILDKVNYKGSPTNNKNIGFEPYNKIIKKYKPLLVICGHVHENQGKQKLGKSWVVNPGAAKEGRAALINVEKERVKSIKFLR